MATSYPDLYSLPILPEVQEIESPGFFFHRPGLALTYVTHAYFDQADATSLFDLLSAYATYCPALLDKIQFIIVDDGSPLPFSIESEWNLNLLHLRITENRPWNQAGARNLGVLAASTQRILLTDIDHIFPEKTLEAALHKPLSSRTFYKFYRRLPNSKFLHSPHSNTFLLDRGRFLGLYGYDEEFSGHYGFEDSFFWRWQRYHGTRILRMPRRYSCSLRRLPRRTSYHSLSRDLRHNRQLAQSKRKEWQEQGPEGGHSRKFLTFPWVVVAAHQRQGREWQPSRSEKRWTRNWLLRWLNPLQ